MLLAFVVSTPVAAYASDVKDSYYFMKDDGEFSDEEKDAEAMYIYGLCGSHSMRNVYYDCGCIAGAFRQKRDDGPLIPQATLFNDLLNDPDTKCTNTVGIAGAAYNHCMEYSKTFRDRETNNEEYCSCVGNKVANTFAKYPRLRSAHIVNIKSQAFSSCRKSVR